MLCGLINVSGVLRCLYIKGCTEAKCYCCYSLPVARLRSLAGLCVMTFGRKRQKSKHTSCCLENQPDHRLAGSLHLSVKTHLMSRGRLRGSYRSQRKLVEMWWDKEE